ncbi:MAG: glycoside hydrolase family 16 protein [Acetobacteraceae bacterium]|nr:glycoside hydrolase family 16 protein [Acetobacteraceae bacterium]
MALPVSAVVAHAQPVIEPAGQNLNALPFSTVQMATVYTPGNPSAQFSVTLTGEGAYSGGNISENGGVVYYQVSPSWSWRQQINAARDPALANTISYNVCDTGTGLCTSASQVLTIHPQSDCGSDNLDGGFVLNRSKLGAANFYDNFYSDSSVLASDAQSKPAGAKWYTHTPAAMDFGYNVLPWDGMGSQYNPFSIIPGQGLDIRVQQDSSGNWHAGGLSSQFPDGSGFTVQYGYVEFRAQMPSGPGVWPALWMNSYLPNGQEPPSTVGIELDLLEAYTQWPTIFWQTTQTWPEGSNNPAQHRWWQTRNDWGQNPGISNPKDPIDGGLHIYGALITPHWITYYFDNTEINRISTPPELSAGMYLMPDLVVGGGGQTATPNNPTDMIVNYIRVYPLPPNGYCTLH